jgi:hypothetical protein
LPTGRRAGTGAFDAIARAGTDPSTAAPYYDPLLTFLGRQAPVVGRIEIPLTQHHYEAAYVAPVVPIARGWERQVDIAVNPGFYDGTLDAGSYRSWLIANGVQFVAQPDAPLDPSAVTEAVLLDHGQPFLTPVWSDAHWRVWRVEDSPGLVTGGARLAAITPATVTLDADAPGPVELRVRWTPYWSVDGPACAAPSPDGWTLLDVTQPGRITLHAVLLGADGHCADP